MDGYVEINLRLQKCLTSEFFIERAVDSAVGDWSEDVREGQEAMSFDDFAMFLFELSSLWCGPNVALSVYLLFINSVYIAITDSRGAHTTGLKNLESIERLPDTFFDLLSLQGWAQAPSEEKALSPDQALVVWLRKNLSPEFQQSVVDHVQRQVFQLTHDVRSVFLFKSEDGKDSRGNDLLDNVKNSTSKLSQVTKADMGKLPPALPPKHTASVRRTDERVRALAHAQQALALPSAGSAVRRGYSAPSAARQPRALPVAEEKVPPQVGRIYATQLVRHQGRGLALAGQAAVSGSRARAQVIGGVDAAILDGGGSTYMSSIQSSTAAQDHATEQEMALALPSGSEEVESIPAPHNSLDILSDEERSQMMSDGVADSRAESAFSPGVAMSPTSPEVHELEQESSAPYEDAGQGDWPSFFDAAALPSYKMPKKPAEVYNKQVGPLISMKPSHIIFDATKNQAANPMLGEPFDRVMRKLPETVRPASGEVPAGPMAHPSEPVWHEMQHRLEAILRKQGRRAERKRKKRLRQKMFHGRPPRSEKRSEGRNLREYLDQSLAEHMNGADVPGHANGEFLGKVQEKYQVHKSKLEQRSFKVYGSTGGPLGESLLRTPQVVRPIYVPPPGADMVGP
eukprot:TRINITY_DN109355_c0_g1_i1.p1 TRINITY_DN109355_c0_g1~~TRINITY_DN109355_c0_g1_i1.p1  ORF type:complete len:716 (-),score=144.34 TRINITY_DN109355_c0_g1_i1:89-1969(-)